jgi:hypothetical protein
LLLRKTSTLFPNETPIWNKEKMPLVERSGHTYRGFIIADEGFKDQDTQAARPCDFALTWTVKRA